MFRGFILEIWTHIILYEMRDCIIQIRELYYIYFSFLNSCSAPNLWLSKDIHTKYFVFLFTFQYIFRHIIYIHIHIFCFYFIASCFSIFVDMNVDIIIIFNAFESTVFLSFFKSL